MFAGVWLVSALWSLLPVIALVIALKALRAVGPRMPSDAELDRLAAIEAQVRALAERVDALEGRTRPGPVSPGVAPPLPPASPVELPAVEPPPVEPVVAPPTAPRLDLEQRIGARWATWVGVVAILFAAAFFLRWAFERQLIGPGLRVGLGLLAGGVMLGAGLALARRRDVPYLAEGLSGGGLGLLYLSLYAAHAFYGLVGSGPAFAGMGAVTAVGAVVAVLSGRQSTAVLALLGGLLTPVLLATEHPDERVLLGYLFALDLLALATARFRTWPELSWLAWLGTAALLAPGFLAEPEPPHLLARLALLSALFLLFLAVPLAREWASGSRVRQIDLLFVVANAAGYFAAVYRTLEATRPAAEAPVALALAVLYAAVASESRRRVPDDEVGALIHLGIADVFLTLGIGLAIHGPWVTLAWAAQGVVLFSVAPRVVTPVAVWGGLAALGLAVHRALLVDPRRFPELVPTLTPADLVHVAVVGCLVWAGVLARRARADQLRLLTPHGLRALCWIAAAGLAAALLWRETTGLWPTVLLAAEALLLGALARALHEPRAPTFGPALALVAAVLLARMFVEDWDLARAAAVSLVNGTLLARAGACLALGVAAGWLARCDAEDGARSIGPVVAAAAGVAGLVVVSLAWSDHEEKVREALGARGRALAEDLRWRRQVGLSVIWTLYAAAALAWGFARSAPRVRYGALGLLGIVIVKVFLVDLAAVETVYRIVSFLILGLVLLGVSLLYQKARGAPPLSRRGPGEPPRRARPG